MNWCVIIHLDSTSIFITDCSLCRRFMLMTSAKESLITRIVFTMPVRRYFMTTSFMSHTLTVVEFLIRKVRASNLSGECSWFQEMLRGHFTYVGGKMECVKR